MGFQKDKKNKEKYKKQKEREGSSVNVKPCASH